MMDETSGASSGRPTMPIHRGNANAVARGRAATRYLLSGFGAILLFTTYAVNADGTSVYTSVKEGECKKPAAALLAFYESRGLVGEECAGVGGWRLFWVGSDERSWFELMRDRDLWSTDEQVVQQNHFGHFPNIGADKVEWRLANTGVPTAFIFRIAAQNPERIDKNLTRLFVIGFKGNTPYFCGVAKSNDEARVLAGKTDSCVTTLRAERPPK